MHGGGMVMGSFDMDDALLVGAVEQMGLAAVSVDYRLAPEHPISPGGGLLRGVGVDSGQCRRLRT